MKKLNEKGITLTTLVIMIIVITILASVTVYVGGGIIKKANLQNVNTNMMLIQAKTKTIAEKAKFNKDTSIYKGTKLAEVSGNQKIEKFLGKNVIEVNDNTYLLSQQDLNEMGLEKVNIEDGYIVNYETEEVIYVKGFEANGQTYYKLSEMKELKIEQE